MTNSKSITIVEYSNEMKLPIIIPFGQSWVASTIQRNVNHLFASARIVQFGFVWFNLTISLVCKRMHGNIFYLSSEKKQVNERWRNKSCTLQFYLKFLRGLTIGWEDKHVQRPVQRMQYWFFLYIYNIIHDFQWICKLKMIRQ